MTVRPATPADLEAVTAIYAEHVRHGTGSFEIDPPDAAEIGRRFDAVRGRGLPWLVAERDGEIVGYAYAGRYHARAAYERTVEDSVYVRADAGRQGVGAALLSDLLDRCAALGYRQMVAVIGDSANAGSIGLHRRFGFADAGLLKSVGRKHGRWLDVVFMQRPLGPGDAEP